MKTMTIRQLRQPTPRLKAALARDGEVVIVSNGEPIARMLPYAQTRPALPSLKSFREAQPQPKSSIEQLVREERDRR